MNALPLTALTVPATIREQVESPSISENSNSNPI